MGRGREVRTVLTVGESWTGASVRMYVGWHWLKRYGWAFPCVCLGPASGNWHTAGRHVDVLLVKPLERGTVCGSLVVDSHFERCTFGRDRGEWDVQSLTHHGMIWTQCKL